MWLHNGLRWDEISSYLLQMQCGFYHVPSVIFFLFYHFRPSHHLYLLIYFLSGFIVCASVCQNSKQEILTKCFHFWKFFILLDWCWLVIGRVGRWKSCMKVLVVCVSHSSLQFPHSCSSLCGVVLLRPGQPGPAQSLPAAATQLQNSLCCGAAWPLQCTVCCRCASLACRLSSSTTSTQADQLFHTERKHTQHAARSIPGLLFSFV